MTSYKFTSIIGALVGLFFSVAAAHSTVTCGSMTYPKATSCSQCLPYGLTWVYAGTCSSAFASYNNGDPNGMIGYWVSQGGGPQVCLYSISGNSNNLWQAQNWTYQACATSPPPTCSDGVQNQGEAGVDCGGPCTAECGPTTTIKTFAVKNPDGSYTQYQAEFDNATGAPIENSMQELGNLPLNEFGNWSGTVWDAENQTWMNGAAMTDTDGNVSMALSPYTAPEGETGNAGIEFSITSPNTTTPTASTSTTTTSTNSDSSTTTVKKSVVINQNGTTTTTTEKTTTLPSGQQVTEKQSTTTVNTPGPNITTVTSTVDPGTISGRMSQFVTNIRTAPIFAPLNSILSPQIGAGSPIINVSFGSYGSSQVNLEDYSNFFAVLRVALLLVAGFVAARIVIANK